MKNNVETNFEILSSPLFLEVYNIPRLLCAPIWLKNNKNNKNKILHSSKIILKWINV
jgi:hypothetical protein